jgi:hypothetical protein
MKDRVNLYIILRSHITKFENFCIILSDIRLNKNCSVTTVGRYYATARKQQNRNGFFCAVRAEML